MDTITCCVVGYGGIAAFHAEAFKQIDGIRLKTVVGRRPEPAEEFAQKMGFETSTTDYDKALADPEIDAVVIASPSELHYDMTTRALQAGKDALVEIPLAVSHEGARNLAALSRKSGRKVMVAHTRRFEPAGKFVKDFLASGKPGRIYQHHSYSFWFRHENIGWTGYRRSWTDDVLFHHGCHLVDFSLWTVNAPIRRVRGELSPLHPGTGTSMDVSVLLRYASETIATISLSYNSRQSAGGNLYVCENGTLVHAGKRVIWNGDPIFGTDENEAGGVLTQNREFIQALRENRQPSCSAQAGLNALVLLQQVYDQMITLENKEKYQRPWGL